MIAETIILATALSGSPVQPLPNSEGLKGEETRYVAPEENVRKSRAQRRFEQRKGIR